MPSYTFDIDKIYLGGIRTNKFTAQARPDDVSVASPICKLLAVPQPGTIATGTVVLHMDQIAMTDSTYFGSYHNVTITSVKLRMVNGLSENVTLSFDSAYMSDDFEITTGSHWITPQSWTVPNNSQAELEILASASITTVNYSTNWLTINGELDITGDTSGTLHVDGSAGGNVYARYKIQNLGGGVIGITDTEFRDSDGNIT